MDQNHNPKKPSFRSVVIQIGIVLLTILLVILLPAALVIGLLVFTFRCLLKFYVKLFKPEFGKIVTIRSSLFATDVPNRNTLMSIVVPVTFKRTIDFEKIRNELLQNVVHQRNSDGSLKYPELQQCLVTFCGYMFWKWEKQFDIKNHVYLGYENKTSLDEEGLTRLSSTLLRKSFGNTKSPWELYFFPEYKSGPNSEPMCMGVVRLSHCMADGFSLIQMISAGSPIPIEILQQFMPTKLKIVKMVFSTIVSIILSPYQLTAAFVSSSDADLFETKESKISKELVMRYSKPIPISTIKELKNKLKTSFEAILITAYTAGVRKLMLESKMEIPESVHSMMPVPVLAMREKLRNNIKYALITLPVGIADPDERQSLIASQVAAQKISRVPDQMQCLSIVLGVFPIALYRVVCKSFRASGVISNLVSPFSDMVYAETVAIDCRFALGLHHGHTWFGITCLTFEGNLRIQTNYVESVAPDAKKDTFCNGIADEIQNLVNKHLV